MTGILFSVSYSTGNPIDIVQIKFMNAYEVFIAMNFDLNIFFYSENDEKYGLFLYKIHVTFYYICLSMQK